MGPLSKQNWETRSTRRPHPSSPITLGRERHHRLFGVELRMALRMSRETDRADSSCPSIAPLKQMSALDLNGPNAAKYTSDHHNAVRLGLAARPRRKNHRGRRETAPLAPRYAGPD